MKDNNINNFTDNDVKDKLNPSQQKEIVLDDLNDKSIKNKIGEKKDNLTDKSTSSKSKKEQQKDHLIDKSTSHQQKKNKKNKR